LLPQSFLDLSCLPSLERCRFFWGEEDDLHCEPHCDRVLNPFSALFWGSVCVVRGLAASSVTFCHYNRDVLFQLPVATGPGTLPDDPSCVETWLSPELRLTTQDNNGISIRTDQWVKYDLSLHAFFWIFGT
jgi:hypothetical protein